MAAFQCFPLPNRIPLWMRWLDPTLEIIRGCQNPLRIRMNSDIIIQFGAEFYLGAKLADPLPMEMTKSPTFFTLSLEKRHEWTLFLRLCALTFLRLIPFLLLSYTLKHRRNMERHLVSTFSGRSKARWWIVTVHPAQLSLQKRTDAFLKRFETRSQMITIQASSATIIFCAEVKQDRENV